MSGGDAARGSILARTARGAGWVVAWRVTTRLLGLASTLVLVRLLAPADFGLVALAAVAATALDVCLCLGVEDQIVRARDPDRALYDTAFTLNLLRAVLVGALVAATAAPAAAFFGDTRLEPVLHCLAALTAAAGLTNIGVVDFRRDLAFDKEFRLMVAPRLAAIAVTIAVAVALRSHWALVAGIATSRLGKVAMSYAMHPYRPRLSLAAWRELAGVSFWSWAISVAALVRGQADTVLVGRALGPAQVGVYAAGLEIATLPTTELVDPICRAAMPGFAAAERAGDGVAQAYLRIVGLTALLGLPAGLGISLVAGPLVVLGYGVAWVGAVPVVALLGAAGAGAPLGNLSQAVLGAQMMLRRMLAILAAAGALRVALLVAGIAWLGLPGAALGVAAGMVVEQAMLLVGALHRLGLRWRDLLGRVWRPLAAAAAMAAGLWAIGLGWAAPPAGGGEAARLLFAGAVLGAVLYAGALGALWMAVRRPAASAEADMLALVARLAGAAGGRLRRAMPPARGMQKG